MAEHEIVWEFDIDTVQAQAVCHAHADARCHQVPSCDCESWDEQEDEDGYFHEIEGQQHRHRQVDYCGIVTWLNADSPLDCAADDARMFEIWRTPIEPVWGDGYMQWRPTLPDWERELLADGSEREIQRLRDEVTDRANVEADLRAQLAGRGAPNVVPPEVAEAFGRRMEADQSETRFPVDISDLTQTP